MASPVPVNVTQLLLAWSQGDEAALDRLIPVVYRELRRLAHRHMGGERLVDTPRVHWQDRTHFFAVCAQLMRRILVDFARSRRYQKCGGGLRLVSLDEAMAAPLERSRDLVALDEALTALAAIDPRKAKVVELRFFGGLTADEAAEVRRDWKMAKVWLLNELSGGTPDDL